MRRDRLGDFNSRFVFPDFDRSNVLSRKVPFPAEHRQQPFRVGVLLAADVETKPRSAAGQTGLTGPFAGLCAQCRGPARFPTLGILPRIDDRLGRRKPRSVEAHEQRAELFGRMLRKEKLRRFEVFFRGRLQQQRVLQHAFSNRAREFPRPRAARSKRRRRGRP